MTVGYGSATVNGQLVPVAIGQAFDPLTFGAAYTGPGMWPRGGQWNVPPLLPDTQVSMVGAGSYSPDMGESAGPFSGQPMPTSGAQKANGKVNWMHPTKSPVLWAVGFLGLSLFMLHKVHYRS